MRLWVGTSGYSYKEWRAKFYPQRFPAKEMLRFYASRFAAVEINNSFYRLPKETVLRSWAEQVPAEFRFVLKAPLRMPAYNKGNVIRGGFGSTVPAERVSVDGGISAVRAGRFGEDQQEPGA